MQKLKLAIIKEGKIPFEKRVPFTPDQSREIENKFPQVTVFCQSSDNRCYKNEEYEQKGIKVIDNVDDCDMLFGIKEVPIHNLVSNKTYFFFSHTVKEQPYNRSLLQAILQKKIRLVDYEMLTDAAGKRIVAFGRYAGIVGAYNGLWTYGKRYKLFNLRRAYECFDLEDLKTEFPKVILPPIKIALTGGGRVAKGAMEVLNAIGIRKVTAAAFLSQKFDVPVYCQLNSKDYVLTKNKTDFIKRDFYQHPENYVGDFLKYTAVTDLLIAAAYWNPKAPVLFTRDDIMKPDFKIKVIADITCDIEGSIPSTKCAGNIKEPIYDYNSSADKIEPPLSDEANITVMAVDNLPCELPRNASEDFGRELIDNVLPHLLKKDEEGIIHRATIAANGHLKEKYSYLQNYAAAANKES